jgi:hypothetical protein
MDNQVIQPQTISEETYTPDQVKEMLLIAHATGWNNGVSKSPAWSDTSLNVLRDKLFLIFKFKL